MRGANFVEHKFKWDTRWLRIALVVSGAVLICLAFYRQVGPTLSVVAVGCILAFIMEPVAELMEQLGIRKRALSVSAAFLLVILALIALLMLMLPPLFAQFSDFSQTMARSVRAMQELLDRFNAFLQARDLPLIQPKDIDWNLFTAGIGGLLSGTRDVAGNVAGALSRFSLSLMLAIYFLLYKHQVLMSLELLIPSVARKLVLRMGANVTTELRQYLRGQLTISLMVGVLSGIGMWLAGTPSPLLLGTVTGVFNLIPYFGPLLAAIPAVVLGLGQGIDVALLSVLVLFVVQQLDGFIISPRVMSGMMGLNPPLVLLAITIGSGISGISGMFFAIPVLLIVRICLRVWASRDEMIEKYPGM